jgi:hypothetical protein
LPGQSGATTGHPSTLNGFTYTPASNTNGLDHFTFSVSDGRLRSTNTVSITIQPVNDAPVAVSQTVTTDEDTPVPVVLSALDVEGDGLTFTNLTQPAHGTLTFNSQPSTLNQFIYTPATNYNGNDSFQFIASDGWLDSAPATILLIIKPVNDAPVADPQVIVTPEDTATNITLNGADVDGDTLTFVIVTPPAHGTLHGTTPQLIYSPAADYNGSDSFTFVANDGQTNSTPAALNLVITPVNDPPVARATALITDEDTPLTLKLTATDVDGDTLAFEIVTPPTNGVLTGTPPDLIYTPAANFNGNDSFTFIAKDGQTNSLPAAVTITINPVNDAPVADGQNLQTLEDQPVNGIVTASDVDGDNLTFALGTPATKGVATVNAAGHFTYIPNPNTNGNDCFTFTVTDRSATATGMVNVVIVPVNDPPVATPQTVTTDENAPLALALTGTDVDGDTLTFQIVNQPAHGTLNPQPLTLNKYIYTPATDYNGPDSFTFKVNDGRLDSASATVAIDVLATTSTLQLNVPGAQTIPHNMPLVFDASRSISITDEDAGLGVLELSLSVSNGTLTLGSDYGLDWQAGANGTSTLVVRGYLGDLNADLAGLSTDLAGLRYHNSSGFSGADLLSVTVDDLGNNDLGINFKDAKTIPITVIAPPNNPPNVSIVAPADTSQFQFGQTIAVEATATDRDGQVTNVTLLADGRKLAELTAPPFATAWTNATLGRHVLSAVATDNQGVASISSGISIWVVDENGDFLVEAGPDQIISLPNTAFLAGTVKIQLVRVPFSASRSFGSDWVDVQCED